MDCVFDFQAINLKRFLCNKHTVTRLHVNLFQIRQICIFIMDERVKRIPTKSDLCCSLSISSLLGLKVSPVQRTQPKEKDIPFYKQWSKITGAEPTMFWIRCILWMNLGDYYCEMRWRFDFMLSDIWTLYSIDILIFNNYFNRMHFPFMYAMLHFVDFVVAFGLYFICSAIPLIMT